MAIIETLRDVGSIASYLSKCTYLRKEWIKSAGRPGDEETLWYRAQPEENLGLIPKLYRPQYRGAYGRVQWVFLPMLVAAAGTNFTCENSDGAFSASPISPS